MKKILAIGVFLFLSACVNMQVTNSDFAADKAEEIARTCPAAAQAAATARQEANRAAAEVASATDASDLLRPMLEQQDRWQQEKAQWEQKKAEAENRIASMNSGGGSVLAAAEQELEACRHLQSCYNSYAGKKWDDPFMVLEMEGDGTSYCGRYNDDYRQDNSRCDCKSWLGCKQKADSLQQGMSEAAKAAAISDKAEAEAYIRLRDEQLQALNQKIAELKARVEAGNANARTSETNAIAAYEEAQKIAAEQCGEGAALKDVPAEPKTAAGGFPQDVFNSQSMGVGASPVGPTCPGSCSAIQSQCNVMTHCTGSPGDDAQCLQCSSCAAQCSW